MNDRPGSQWPATSDGRHRSKRGQALVETALILPLLMLMLVGIIEFGRLLFTQHAVTNAAREGGRVAILPNKAESDVVGAVASVLQRSGLDATKATTSVSGVWGSTGSPTNVTVTYPYRSVALEAVLAIIPGGTDAVSQITISSSSNMIKE
ncbi:MAG: pilus assembly protein [Acidobacteria bacterium]|nr:pilus assembly protein [Acidobacteriota bacterium]